jgi:hypothetical protein
VLEEIILPITCSPPAQGSGHELSRMASFFPSSLCQLCSVLAASFRASCLFVHLHARPRRGTKCLWKEGICWPATDRPKKSCLCYGTLSSRANIKLSRTANMPLPLFLFLSPSLSLVPSPGLSNFPFPSETKGQLRGKVVLNCGCLP